MYIVYFNDRNVLTQTKCASILYLIYTKKDQNWALNMVLFFVDLVLMLLPH